MQSKVWDASIFPGSASFVRFRRKLDQAATLAASAFLILTWNGPVIEQTPAGQTGAGAVQEAMGPGAASAQPGRETLIAAYSGAPYTYSSDVTVKKEGTHDFTMKDVQWIGEPFKSPIYYGVRVARWFEGGRTGAMIDFTHSKATAERELEADFTGTLNGKPAPARTKISDVFEKLEATHGHNMLTFNGLLRLPSIHAWLSPYVGIGAGVSLPHSEVHMKGEQVRTYEYQFAGPVLQGLFGLEFRAAQASYFVEYKFTYAPYDMPLSQQNGYLLWTDLWRQFSNWMKGGEPPGGRLTTTFASHQIIGGLGIRVVPAVAQ